MVALLLGQQLVVAQDKNPPPIVEGKNKEEAKKDEVKDEKKEKTTDEKISDAAADAKGAKSTADEAMVRGDTAWMLVATAFVMLMVPGLALFYGGMVRRKNVLATMMQ